jgi:SsrA-binding protein
LVLQGTEVKSLRQGRANLKDAYARIEKGEIWLHQLHIGVYDHAYYGNHDPLRPRKLLLHKAEIQKLTGKVNEAGRTLVPLSLYFVKGRVKVKLALARGKHAFDKRDTIRRRDAQRDMERTRAER